MTVEHSITRATTTAPPIALKNIAKSYGAVKALRDISLELPRGQITGLVGDNGAGKSTIIKLISGVTQPTSGNILLDGKPQTINSPPDALQLGIETVYQDLALSPDLSVWANFFMGHELVRGGPLGVLDKRAMIRKAESSLKDLQIKIQDVKVPCGALSGGQKQAIAVGRAISWGTRVLLMDEPTAALGTAQRNQVGALARQAADRGIPVLIISHDLPWVQEICDTINVLYRGHITANLGKAEASIDEIIGHITGSRGGAQ